MLKFVRNAWLWIAVGILIASGSVVGVMTWLRSRVAPGHDHPTHI